MSDTPLVTRDRQSWHEEVENEILDQFPRGSTSVKKIVTAVLSRDPTYPAGAVERYVEYLLQFPIILGFWKPATERYCQAGWLHSIWRSRVFGVPGRIQLGPSAIIITLTVFSAPALTGEGDKR